MTTIQAVLFDADGVVINPRLQFSRHLEEVYAITPAMTRHFFQGVFNDCLRGQADLLEVLPPYLKEWGWKGSAKEFACVWLKEDDHPDGRLLDAIQHLRRAGYLCGLATLQEKKLAAYMKTNMGFDTLFDQLFFSCEMGCLKPDPTYFRHVEQSLQLPGDAILFWDDDPRNIAAARQLGWNAQLYTTFEAFEKDLPGLLPVRPV